MKPQAVNCDEHVSLKSVENEIDRKFLLRNSLASLDVLAVATLLGVPALSGCDIERRKSDAELGLNPQQAAGRKIYDNHCDRCHRPYSTKGRKGPGLKGIFRNKYLPQTGLPANDDRVTDIIRNGRPDMPGYSQVLSAQDIQDLLAYLHTL